MFFKHPWPLCFKQSHIFFSWKKIMVHVQLVKHYGKIKKKKPLNTNLPWTDLATVSIILNNKNKIAFF